MTYRGVMDLERSEWSAYLGLPDSEVPHGVILEGSWWRAQRTTWRLGRLDEVRELAFPDMFWGRWRDRPVVYSCVYGASRAVELAHLFSVLGTRLLVTIGTCGALEPDMATGDVVVPGVAVPGEGIARFYGAPHLATADPDVSSLARTLLTAEGRRVHDGLHLTWHSIFVQTSEMVEAWRRLGYSSVDMETATSFAVGRHFGVPSVAMLAVWDLLDRGTSFLDPLEPDAQRALDGANAVVFETALRLVAELP